MPEVAARVPPVASSREKSALQDEFCKRLLFFSSPMLGAHSAAHWTLRDKTAQRR
jgi:hypothetical protein